MDKETALAIYEKMVLIRKFEEMLYYIFSTQKMPGSMHQYNGQEAVAAAVCAHLDDNDYVTSTHRGHGHCIAKGIDVNAVMAEIFAKKTGCCKGMGGSMHISDISKGIIGANGIVGAGIPIAAGAALACQYDGSRRVAVCFFGDGASNEGAFHEGINLAAAWKLPVVFVCENNLYGYTTPFHRVAAVTDIAVRAEAYGITGRVADGMDACDVYEKAGALIEQAREGGGPSLLECKTYRFMGHSRFEKPTYRTQEELEEWKRKDPIPRFRAGLSSMFACGEEEIAAIEQAVAEKIDRSVEYAQNSPDAGPEDYRQYIFV